MSTDSIELAVTHRFFFFLKRFYYYTLIIPVFYPAPRPIKHQSAHLQLPGAITWLLRHSRDINRDEEASVSRF